MVIVAVNYRMHLNLIRIIGLDARMYVREGNGHIWSLLLITFSVKSGFDMHH